MSYFVTVTFDLNYASMSPHGNNVYRKITDALDAVDYSQVVAGKKGRLTQRPDNTYVAEFEGANVDRSREITEFVAKELRKIFSAYSVTGKFFISSGKGWAWKSGTF